MHYTCITRGERSWLLSGTSCSEEAEKAGGVKFLVGLRNLWSGFVYWLAGPKSESNGRCLEQYFLGSFIAVTLLHFPQVKVLLPGNSADSMTSSFLACGLVSRSLGP